MMRVEQGVFVAETCVHHWLLEVSGLRNGHSCLRFSLYVGFSKRYGWSSLC